MNKLVETKKERYWTPEAWTRDQWVRAEAAKLVPGSHVLDVGAGSSKYRPFFSHCRYETQDLCHYQGDLVKYVAPIDYVCDLTAIPLPEASLDALLCAEVLEHVVDPIAALAEFSRLLKPGGRLLLTAPHGTLLHMEPYHYYSGFTHFWYRHWLPRFGFEIESISPQGGPGRSAVTYIHGFYDSWRKWERTLHGPKRLLSLFNRMLVKVPVHYVLPRLLPFLDPRLDRSQICLGFMVASTRVAKAASPVLIRPEFGTES